MAVAAENMDFDELEAACAGYICRALQTPFVSAPLPRGSWNHVNFPMLEIGMTDHPLSHYIEGITGHAMQISFQDLELNYKRALKFEDLQLLPSPFGPKTSVPNNVKLQMAIVEEEDATTTIMKHTSSQTKPNRPLSRPLLSELCTSLLS